MSGIAAAWCLDGSPGAKEAVEAMMARLAHRGPQGQDVWCSPDGTMALGHLHFWTTPEEVGEEQPLWDGKVALALDGRLDNRRELAAGLGVPSSQLLSTSDAALALRAFQAWDEDAFRRLAGVWALVVMDPDGHRVLWTRDAVGRRTLFVFRNARWLLLASEPAALLAHPAVKADLDDTWLASLFAGLPAGGDRSFYAAIREVVPGQACCWDRRGVRSLSTWQPDLEPRIVRDGDGALVEEFAHLLQQAVARRLRSTGDVGVLMSGGLDSSTVAALVTKSRSPGQRLKTISYIYEDLEQLDERSYISDMVDRYDLEPSFVVADDAWPLQGIDRWPFDWNQPLVSPLWYLWDRVFEAASRLNVVCLLSGHGGDELYTGIEYWLVDLLRAGRWREAWQEVRAHAAHLGWRAVLRSNSVRRVLAATLPCRSRPVRRLAIPKWLTPYARQLVADATSETQNVHRTRTTHALGPDVAGEALANAVYHHRARIELREPYRDRELIAFMLRLPAYWLYNQGAAKRILRDAFGQLLPPSILNRRRATDISPLYRRGFERQAEVVYRTVVEPAHDWRRFVRADWLSAVWPGLNLGFEEWWVIWSVICYAFWERAQARSFTLFGPKAERSDVACTP